MPVLFLSCGFCVSVSFHVSRSFLLWKGLFLVSLRMFLSCLVSWSQWVVVSSFNVFLWSSKLTWRGGSVGLCSCCTGLIIFMVKKKYPAKVQGIKNLYWFFVAWVCVFYGSFTFCLGSFSCVCSCSVKCL